MTLQAALSYDAKPGEKVNIYLQGSEYKITEPLVIKDGFTLYGGFAGKEFSESFRIMYDIDNNGIIESWEYMAPTVFKGKGVILKFSGSGTVDGVTLQSASDGSGSIVELTSGGILQNSIIIDRKASDSGIININDGALLSCYVHDNETSGNGVIHIDGSATVSHSRIEKNQAGNGGAIYVDTTEDVYIVNNLIANNSAVGVGTAKGEGGAIYIGGAAKTSIINNTIVYNSVSGGDNSDKTGTGIHINVNDENTVIKSYNNVIWKNDGGDQVYRYFAKGGEVPGTYIFKNNALGSITQDWVSKDDNIDIAEEKHADLFISKNSYIPKRSSILADFGDDKGYNDNVGAVLSGKPSLKNKDLKNESRIDNVIDIGAYESKETPIQLNAIVENSAPSNGGGGVIIKPEKPDDSEKPEEPVEDGCPCKDGCSEECDCPKECGCECCHGCPCKDGCSEECDCPKECGCECCHGCPCEDGCSEECDCPNDCECPCYDKPECRCPCGKCKCIEGCGKNCKCCKPDCGNHGGGNHGGGNHGGGNHGGGNHGGGNQGGGNQGGGNHGGGNHGGGNQGGGNQGGGNQGGGNQGGGNHGGGNQGGGNQGGGNQGGGNQGNNKKSCVNDIIMFFYMICEVFWGYSNL